MQIVLPFKWRMRCVRTKARLTAGSDLLKTAQILRATGNLRLQGCYRVTSTSKEINTQLYEYVLGFSEFSLDQMLLWFTTNANETLQANN